MVSHAHSAPGAHALGVAGAAAVGTGVLIHRQSAWETVLFHSGCVVDPEMWISILAPAMLEAMRLEETHSIATGTLTKKLPTISESITPRRTTPAARFWS